MAWGGGHGLGRGIWIDAASRRLVPARDKNKQGKGNANYYNGESDEETDSCFVCQSGDIVTYLFGDSGAFCDGRQDDDEKNQYSQERKDGYVDGGHGMILPCGVRGGKRVSEKNGKK